MWVYAWLLVLPPALALGRRLSPRAERIALLLVWLALTLLIGLRRGLGIDWDNYLIMFVRAGAFPLPEAMTLSEPGYMLVSAIAARLGFALPVVNLVCAAIFAAGLMMFVRIQKSPALALLIAIPVLVVLAGVATRQSVAIGLMMAALALYASGRRRLPSWLLVASLPFHWTAVLLLPFIPAMLVRRIPLWLIVGAGAAAGAMLAAALLSVPILAERFAYLPPSGGAALHGSLTLLALVLLFALRRRLDFSEPERRVAACLAALGLFALMLTPVLSVAADRIGFYAVPLQMMVLTRAAGLVPAGPRRNAVLAGIILPYLALFAAWMALTSYRTCLSPYRSYLADPAALRTADPEAHRRPFFCTQGQVRE